MPRLNPWGWATLLSLATLFLLGCGTGKRTAPSGGGDPPAASDTKPKLAGKLTLTGSSTMAPLLSDIAKRFEEFHPDVRVDVQTGGSSRGIHDVTTGLADIGMSSRALKDSEKEMLTQHILAQDGICFLVHKTNPVQELTYEQLKAIYLGHQDDWKRLGGPEGPITVINRADGRSELELFLGHFGIKAEQIKADAIAGENRQGIKQVASDPLAIVFMSVGTSEFEVKNGTTIRMLPLRGIEAGSKTVADGTFPLSRALILVTRRSVSPLIQAFIDFAQSQSVHDLVKEHSFVPVAP